MRRSALRLVIAFPFACLIFINASAQWTPSSTNIYLNNSYNRVGINTLSPAGVLHLVGASNSSAFLHIERTSVAAEAGISFNLSGTNQFYFFVDDGSNSLKLESTGMSGEADATPRMEFPFASKNIYMGGSGGSVGIGTKNVNGYKLAVEGVIGAREVNVNSSTWADYVFAPGYKLPSLQTVEKFIKENHHLPEIPSAKEVDEKGVNVGEMNALLLKKIEELTLYVIDQQKQIDELKPASKK